MDLVELQPVASDARGAEPPVPRHLYNPEEDGASRARRQQLREGQAVAGRSGGHVGIRSGVVCLSEEVRSTTRPPVALCQPTEGASISLSDKDIEMFTGVLVVRKAAAGCSMILEGNPAEWLART
jgi:hypothetical protein